MEQSLWLVKVFLAGVLVWWRFLVYEPHAIHENYRKFRVTSIWMRRQSLKFLLISNYFQTLLYNITTLRDHQLKNVIVAREDTRNICMILRLKFNLSMFLLFWACMGRMMEGTCHDTCGHNFQESVFSFHHGGSRDQVQVIRLVASAWTCWAILLAQNWNTA